MTVFARSTYEAIKNDKDNELPQVSHPPQMDEHSSHVQSVLVALGRAIAIAVGEGNDCLAILGPRLAPVFCAQHAATTQPA